MASMVAKPGVPPSSGLNDGQFNMQMYGRVNNSTSNLAFPPYSAPDAFSPSQATAQPLNQGGTMMDSTFTELDEQAVTHPSYEYDDYRQQTGLPPGSLPQPGYSHPYGSMMMRPPPDDVNMGGFAQGQPMRNSFDAPSGSFINPRHLVFHQGSQYQRAYPGMHQERAKQAEAQMKQQLREQQMAQNQQQKANKQDQGMHTQNAHHKQPEQLSSRQPGASAKPNEAAARILAQFQQTASMITGLHQFPDPHEHMPHIVRAKKSEEQMDEDEKTLASEKAKEMDAQKRRQLRNKVSARHFRSRRKEYISDLEQTVELLGKKNLDATRQNLELQLENASLREFTQKLLSHDAFQPFLESIVVEEQEKLQMKMTSPQAVLATAVPLVQGPVRMPRMEGQAKNASITPTMAHAMPVSQPMSSQMSNVPVVNSQMVSPALSQAMLAGNGLQVSPSLAHQPTIKVDNGSPMVTHPQMQTPYQQHAVPQGMANFAPPPLMSQPSTMSMSSHGTTVSPQMQNMVINPPFDFNDMSQPMLMHNTSNLSLPDGMNDMGMGMPNNLMQPMQGMNDIDLSEYVNMPMDSTG